MVRISLVFLVTFFLAAAFGTYAYADGVDEITYLGEVDVENVSEYKKNEDGIQLFSSEPDWIDEGSDNYYDFLENNKNGKKYQKFYKKLYKAMKNFTYDDTAKPIYNNGRYYIFVDITEFRTLTFSNKDSDGNYLKDKVNMYNTYNALLQDNPQFFYRGTNFITTVKNDVYYFGIQISEEYVDNEFKIYEADAITSALDEYDDKIDKHMSNYQIEKIVYEQVILDNTYNYDENGDPCSETYAHSIAGSLNLDYGGGVCESYARTIQFLLNRYDVDCYYVAGESAYGSHAWNYVQLDDDEYYCVDSTFDDPSGANKLKFAYFNQPYTSFYENSGRDNSLTYYTQNLPECSEKTDYYCEYANQSTGLTKAGRNGVESVVYCSLDFDESQTRETVTEPTTEKIETKTYEYEIESTTCDLQPVAGESIYDIILVNEGDWSLEETENGYGAKAAKTGARLSFVTREDCFISYKLDLTGNAKIRVYIDDEEYTENPTTGKFYTIDVPTGSHKITFEYKASSKTYSAVISRLAAVSKGDSDANGLVDLSDAIAVMQIDEIDSSDTKVLKYCDMDNDNIITNRDVELILKKISGIAY